MIPQIRRTNRQGTTAPGVTSASVRARGFSPRFARTSDFNEGNVNWTALAGTALGGLAAMAAKNRRETYIEEAGLDAQFAKEAGEKGKQAAVDASAEGGYDAGFIESITDESAPSQTSRDFARLRREGMAHTTAEYQLQARTTAGADIARDIDVRAQELINESRMAADAKNTDASVPTWAPEVEKSYAQATAEVVGKLAPSALDSEVMMRTIRTELDKYREGTESRISAEINNKNAEAFKDRVANANADILVNATMGGVETNWDEALSTFSAQSHDLKTEGGYKELVQDSIRRAMNRLDPEDRLELVDQLKEATLGGAPVSENGDLMGFLEQTENNAIDAITRDDELRQKRRQLRKNDLDADYTDGFKYELDMVLRQDLNDVEVAPVTLHDKVKEIVDVVQSMELEDWEKVHIITDVHKYHATLAGTRQGEGSSVDSPIVAQHVSNLIAQNKQADAMDYLDTVTMSDAVLRRDLKELVGESKNTAQYSSQHKIALGISSANMQQMEGRGFDEMAGMIRKELADKQALAVARANDIVRDGKAANKTNAEIQQDVEAFWIEKNNEITAFRSQRLAELEETVSQETMAANDAANRGKALNREDYPNLQDSEFNTLAVSARETAESIDETKLTTLNGKQGLLTASARASLEGQEVDLESARGNAQLQAVTQGLTDRINKRADEIFQESIGDAAFGESPRAVMSRAVDTATAEVLQEEGTLTPEEIEGLQAGGEAQKAAVEIGQTRSRKEQERQATRETVEGAQRVYKSPDLGEAVFNANNAKNPKKLGKALKTQKRQAISAIRKNGFQDDGFWSGDRWAPEEGDQEALRQAVAAHGFTVDDAINGSVLVEIDRPLVQENLDDEYLGRSESLPISTDTDLESVRMFESRADFDEFTQEGFETTEDGTFRVRPGTKAAQLQETYNMSDDEMEDWVVAQDSYISQAEGEDPSGAPESPPEPSGDQPDSEVTEEPEATEEVPEEPSEEEKAKAQRMERRKTRKKAPTRGEVEKKRKDAEEAQETKDLSDRVGAAADKIDAALAEDEAPENEAPENETPEKEEEAN